MLTVLLVLAQDAEAASRSERVRQLVAVGDEERARRKCSRWNADNEEEAAADVREACAQAHWPLAEALNSVEGWRDFRATWSDTALERTAFEREADAELALIGMESTEQMYRVFREQYPDTKAAKQALQLQAKAAVRDCSSDADALRIVRTYDWYDGLTPLVERNLSAFVQVEFHEGLVSLSIDPPVPLPKGKALSADWAARRSDGSYVPWNIEARRMLLDVGFPRGAVDRIEARDVETTAYPRCFHSTGQRWELGVEVKLGTSRAFFPGPWEQGCGPSAWPMFLAVKRGKISGIAIRPGFTVDLPIEQQRGAMLWGPDQLALQVPGDPGDPVVVGNVIGQQMEGLNLIFPMTGAMPWLFPAQAPPDWAIPLTPSIQGAALPPGWVLARVGEVTQAEHGTTTWRLPTGEVRVLSPLMQRILGLQESIDLTGIERASPLPPASSPSWTNTAGRLVPSGPAGSTSVGLRKASDAMADRIAAFYGTSGSRLTVLSAWAVQMDEDPEEEIVFEGRVVRHRVRGVYDPLGGERGRLFIYRANTVDARLFAFQLAGFTYVAWVGRDGPATWYEALHFDGAGLDREYSEAFL